MDDALARHIPATAIIGETASRDGSVVEKSTARVRRMRSATHRSGQVTMRRVLKAVASEMGKRGGKARMATMTPEQRRDIGRRGAAARWGRR
jgi:general stress protein YciG